MPLLRAGQVSRRPLIAEARVPCRVSLRENYGGQYHAILIYTRPVQPVARGQHIARNLLLRYLRGHLKWDDVVEAIP